MNNAIIVVLSCIIFFASVGQSSAHQITEQYRKKIRETLVHITVFTEAIITDENNKIRFEEISQHVGSGVIANHNEGKTFILTAAHVCDLIFEHQKKKAFPTYNPRIHKFSSNVLPIISDVDGKYYPGHVFTISKNYDMCIILTEKIDKKNMKISNRGARISERVYAMSYPANTWNAKIVPTFEGFYAGNAKTENGLLEKSIYTIPTTFGSSGGPIFTNKGELIGIITNGNRKFENINAAATYEQLIDFYDFSIQVYENNAEKINNSMKNLEKINTEMLMHPEKIPETPPIPEKSEVKLPSVPGFE